MQRHINIFSTIVDNCNIIFQKEPQFKRGILGLGSTYSHSDIITDESEVFFKRKEEFVGKKYFQRKPKEEIKIKDQGFCIRTGKTIPFNPKYPMSKEAFDSWVKYKNRDFPERYCYQTGKSSNGKTTMNNPIL